MLYLYKKIIAGDGIDEDSPLKEQLDAHWTTEWTTDFSLQKTYMDDDDLAWWWHKWWQGQPSLRAEFHSCHIVIVAKSTCCKFVLKLEEKLVGGTLRCYIKYRMWLICYNCILACDKCDLVMDDVIPNNQLLGYKYPCTCIVKEEWLLVKLRISYVSIEWGVNSLSSLHSLLPSF